MTPQRRTRLFLTLAWMVVAVQAATFVAIDAELPGRSQAWHRYEGSDDIIEISLREERNPMSRYSLWVAMAEIAPGSTLYVTSPTDLAPIHRARAFGLADEVVVTGRPSRDYDGDDFLEYVVASGPGAHKGPPWMVALDPAKEPGGDPANPDTFLPDALAGGSRGSNPGPPREFVYLAWRGAPVTDRARDHYNYYNVLIEVSLLSQEQRDVYGIDEAGD